MADEGTQQTAQPPPLDVDASGAQRRVLGADGITRTVEAGSVSATSETEGVDGSTTTVEASASAQSVDGGPVTGAARLGGTYASDGLGVTADVGATNATGPVVLDASAEGTVPIVETDLGSAEAFVGGGATVTPGTPDAARLYGEAGARFGFQEGADQLAGEVRLSDSADGPAAVEAEVSGRARIVDAERATLDAVGQAGGALPLDGSAPTGFVRAGLEGAVRDGGDSATASVTYQDGTGQSPTVRAAAELRTTIANGAQVYLGANGTYSLADGAVVDASAVLGVTSEAGAPASIDAASRVQAAVQDRQLLNAQLDAARSFVANYGPVKGMMTYETFIATAQKAGLDAAVGELPQGLAVGTDAAMRREIGEVARAVDGYPKGERAGVFAESGAQAAQMTYRGLNVIETTRAGAAPAAPQAQSPARALDAPEPVGLER